MSWFSDFFSGSIVENVKRSAVDILTATPLVSSVGPKLLDEAGRALSALQPKFPDAPQPAAAAPPGVDNSAAIAAAAAEASAVRKRQGMRSTLLTGPTGVTNPATTLKTVLG